MVYYSFYECLKMPDYAKNVSIFIVLVLVDIAPYSFG